MYKAENKNLNNDLDNVHERSEILQMLCESAPGKSNNLYSFMSEDARRAFRKMCFDDGVLERE